MVLATPERAATSSNVTASIAVLEHEVDRGGQRRLPGLFAAGACHGHEIVVELDSHLTL